MKIIDFLNQNQGAMITLLTAVYVIATVITVYMISKSNQLTRESNKLGTESLKQDLQFERDRNRPYVIFDFVFEHGCVHALLENLGKTPALNIRVALGGELKCIDNKPAPFMNQSIAFMAPGRVLTSLINVSHQFFKEHEEPVFRVTLEYQSTGGEKYEETVTIDLEHRKGLSRIVPPDYAKETTKKLDEIGKHLGDIKSSLNDLAWEHNALLERPWRKNYEDMKEFDAATFLKKRFDTKSDYQRREYMWLLSHFNTAESEEARTKILACEQMGLVRRERSYFVLTEKGHELIAEEESSGGDET